MIDRIRRGRCGCGLRGVVVGDGPSWRAHRQAPALGTPPLPDPPSDSDLIRAFPVITPKPSAWVPKFPVSLRSNEEQSHRRRHHGDA